MARKTLTDTQLAILSTAAGRDDRIALPVANSVKAAGKTLERVLHRLVERGLPKEVTVECDEKALRRDEGTGRVGLRLIEAGARALGLDAPESLVVPTRTGDDAAQTAPVGPTGPAQPRAGTKKARLLAMLSSESDATVERLSAELGWQAHTTRAALTGLRKAGFNVERVTTGGGPAIYRIAGQGCVRDAA